jgi:hypothetical protein
MYLMLGTQVIRKILQLSRANIILPGMKKEIVDFIARCLECQKVKVEHRHPVGFLQPLPIPKWKWEVVTMDFVTTRLVYASTLHKSFIIHFGK